MTMKGKPRDRRPAAASGPLADWQMLCPLRKARMRVGMTQRGLAAAARTSDVTVRSLEQGATQTSEVLVRLAAALGDSELPEAFGRWLKRRPKSDVAREIERVAREKAAAALGE